MDKNGFDVTKVTTPDEAVEMLSFLNIAVRVLPQTTVIKIRPVITWLIHYIEFFEGKRIVVSPDALRWAATCKLVTVHEVITLKNNMPTPMGELTAMPPIYITEAEVEVVTQAHFKEIKLDAKLAKLPVSLDVMYSDSDHVRMLGPTNMKQTLGVKIEYPNDIAKIVDTFIKDLQRINPIIMRRMEGVHETTTTMIMRWKNIAFVVPKPLVTRIARSRERAYV